MSDYQPNLAYHPEHEPGWKFGDDDIEDTVDADDDGYEAADSDALGLTVAEEGSDD